MASKIVAYEETVSTGSGRIDLSVWTDDSYDYWGLLEVKDSASMTEVSLPLSRSHALALYKALGEALED